MELVPTLLLSLAGLVLIAIALRDIFDVLFHHEGHASLSRAITRTVWRTLRRAADVRAGMFSLAGPYGLVATIAVWAILLLVGWALLIWPHLAGFETAAGRPATGGFWEALHISGGVLSTMGFGDVSPVDQWLRVLAPLEALLGFGLLTASVTWLFAVHPAVQQRRALAYELWLLQKASDGEHDGSVIDAQMFTELTSRIVAVERDLVSIPASYYFRDPDERLLLSAQLPFLRTVVRQASDDEDPGTARRARVEHRDRRPAADHRPPASRRARRRTGRGDAPLRPRPPQARSRGVGRRSRETRSTSPAADPGDQRDPHG